MHRIVRADTIEGFRLALTFDDGVEGTVDLSYLAGKGVFACWLEPGVFGAVRIGSSGELLWGNETDLCPDSLYLKVTGKTIEEVFPGTPREPVHA